MPSKIGVAGIGLIGGSIARRLTSEVIVWDADRDSLESAKSQGIQAATSLDDLVNSVDVLVIGVPFSAFDTVFAAVQVSAARREKPIVVTNVLSVMKPVEVTEPNVHFVAGHPMAGTENSGFEASFAELFDGARWVLSDHQAELEALVTQLGATAVIMPAELHNEAVARVSHLPHVLAAAQLLATPEDDEIFGLAASSFRDSTRVAATRPELTSSMVTNNRKEVLRAIEALKGVLDEFAEALETKNDQEIFDMFERANILRQENL
jgi:prephenate dehydrogenase